MARGVRLTAASAGSPQARPRLAADPWLVACAVLAGLALALWWQPAARWDWQPVLAASQPWRWISAAGVHWSALHLGANLLGLAMVALLGRRAGCDRRATMAWLLSWPLTQLGLLLQPALHHYGGLSGVLHAGVAVACCQLMGRQQLRARRHIGALLLAGLLAKVLLEAPWQAPLRHGGGWDFAVAPLAHATGTAAGLWCGAVLLWIAGGRVRRTAGSAGGQGR